MSFGNVLLDALFGVCVAVALGAWLDHRKQAWRGRKAPQSPYATPDYKGGMKLPREKKP